MGRWAEAHTKTESRGSGDVPGTESIYIERQEGVFVHVPRFAIQRPNDIPSS